ncbi:MAG: hypothetical protein V3T31_04520, partial [candidate division Zixibacteria bacterium]
MMLNHNANMLDLMVPANPSTPVNPTGMTDGLAGSESGLQSTKFDSVLKLMFAMNGRKTAESGGANQASSYIGVANSVSGGNEKSLDALAAIASNRGHSLQVWQDISGEQNAIADQLVASMDKTGAVPDNSGAGDTNAPLSASLNENTPESVLDFISRPILLATETDLAESGLDNSSDPAKLALLTEQALGPIQMTPMAEQIITGQTDFELQAGTYKVIKAEITTDNLELTILPQSDGQSKQSEVYISLPLESLSDSDLANLKNLQPTSVAQAKLAVLDHDNPARTVLTDLMTKLNLKELKVSISTEQQTDALETTNKKEIVD